MCRFVLSVHFSSATCSLFVLLVMLFKVHSLMLRAGQRTLYSVYCSLQCVKIEMKRDIDTFYKHKHTNTRARTHAHTHTTNG